jgi:hypothetical protein
MKNLFFTFLFLCLVFPAYAQMNEGAFITGSLGAKLGGGSGNPYMQNSGTSILLSTSAGIPLFNNVLFYSRISFISRSGYTAQENINTPGTGITTINQLTEVNGTFSQLIFNGGLQYNIHLTDDLTMGINGGLTYALVNHKASLPGGTVLQSLDNEGIFGAFSGVNLEKSFEDSNVSLFGEAQYNYAKKDVVYFRDKFSGMNFTFGGKYYFGQ